MSWLNLLYNRPALRLSILWLVSLWLPWATQPDPARPNETQCDSTRLDPPTCLSQLHQPAPANPLKLYQPVHPALPAISPQRFQPACSIVSSQKVPFFYSTHPSTTNQPVPTLPFQLQPFQITRSNLTNQTAPNSTTARPDFTSPNTPTSQTSPHLLVNKILLVAPASLLQLCSSTLPGYTSQFSSDTHTFPVIQKRPSVSIINVFSKFLCFTHSFLTQAL